MCTVTWLRHAKWLTVLCNRDERLTRRVGVAPRVHRAGEVCFLAPIDGEQGGTWISVNALGLCVSLLNGETSESGAPAEEVRSRGLLVLELAPLRSITEADAHLRALDLATYRPFQLLLASDAGEPLLACWNGGRLDWQVAPPLLSSSSLDHGRALAERRRLFEASVIGATEPLIARLQFHRSHAPARGPWSPCMHRADAASVSLCRVEVGAERVALAYAGGAPCRAVLGAPLELLRSS
jgi:hypothetical protein